MGKAAKSTKKFASSGRLKATITARRKHQQIQKRQTSKKSAKPKGKDVHDVPDAVGNDGGEGSAPRKGKGTKGMSVDDILGGGFMDGSDDEDDEMSGEAEDDSEDEGDDVGDDESFRSIDELEEEGDAHMLELSKLAEKDPEFYKFLQENDNELLNFDAEAGERGDDSEDDDDLMDEGAMEEEDRMPVLTKSELRQWQKALLEHRSLRALRKLLIAFRSAAHMNEDGQVLAWSIDSSSVYQKLVSTALKYTPVVLDHHVPYKTQSNGKFKPPTQTPKLKALQKLILSYFHNVIHILGQLSDPETLQLAVTESAKIIPYIVSSRKAVKLYLKTCLDLWSSAEDSIRIAAFLAIRKLASATDDSILDTVLKGTYLTLVRSCKSTNAHSLPSINLMKNSASEIFCLDHATAYQHAFGYIRQLAIHLRNSMKVKTKEAYKQVYNWQFVHCIDFWAIVLARACDAKAEAASGKESELKALIYPLVQVSLGSIKLISNARSYPFHLHIIRSLQQLTSHTSTYIPLPPYLLPILTSTLTPSSKPKPTTLRPLDLDVHIRAPQQYLKTRVYAEGLVEETAFILAEWLASAPVQGSIAFPEIVVPVTVVLRKSVKNANNAAKSGAGGKAGKEVAVVKGLVERVEESAKWVEGKRAAGLVSFAPGRMEGVKEWEADVREKLGESPLGKYLKVVRKTREKRKALVDKARVGEDEMLED